MGITAAYNSANRHFTFHSGITGFSIVVPNSQYKYLGLSTGTHISTGTTLFSLESDEVVDLSGTNEINIVTSLQVNSTNTENGNLNRLVSVYPNCAVGEMVQYTNESFHAIKLRNDSLMFERFTLLDEWNQILDLKEEIGR